MKVLGTLGIVGVGLVCFGGPAFGQWQQMGEAVKKGASDAAKQEVLRQAGVPTPAAPAAPEADAGAATAAAGAPEEAPAAAGAPGEAPAAPAEDAPAAPADEETGY